MGFCGPQLVSPVSWYAAVAAECDVTCDEGAQLAGRQVWYPEQYAPAADLKEGISFAALFESSSQVPARGINFFGSALTDTRRATRAGF